MSIGDTLGAIDLLQDWSETNRATPPVTDLLDFLQLPEINSTRPVLDTAVTPQIPKRRLWTARVQGTFFADLELPASGSIDLQRCFPVGTPDGATDIIAGVSAGSWLEEERPNGNMELWTGIDLRRTAWNGRIETWGGWSEGNLPEAGVSGSGESKRTWNGWDFRHGPIARYSWRNSRYAGWSTRAFASGDAGLWEMGGSIRARQDPPWPAVMDAMHLPVRFARERAQATLHAALTRSRGSLRYGPQADLDGRVSLASDRWSDSVGTGPRTIAARSERRAELACIASAFVRWEPSRTWFLEAAAGWAWVAEEGFAGLELSPFNKGPFLHLEARTSF